jgi:hypothetical protein
MNTFWVTDRSDIHFLGLTLSLGNAFNFTEDNISKNNVQILSKEQSKTQVIINIIELVDIST